MADALVVSGSGAYVDPWHDFGATSARLAEIVVRLGYDVELTGDVEATLSEPQAALLIVNVGGEAEPRPPDRMDAVAAGLARHLANGGGLLGVHSSANAFVGMREWPGILGGRWVRGVSMHPPRGEFVASVTQAEHPVVADLGDIALDDERYCWLETQPDITVLYEHPFEGVTHPLVWARETGPGRVVYCALGHDVGAYEAPGHQALLGRAIRWLARDLDGDRKSG